MTDTVANPSTPDPELVHGSLITLRRKCGKSVCRCVDGEWVCQLEVAPL
ncbi:MAG: hypothetical protein ACRDQF_06100 [Thermocrispum sp.]